MLCVHRSGPTDMFVGKAAKVGTKVLPNTWSDSPPAGLGTSQTTSSFSSKMIHLCIVLSAVDLVSDVVNGGNRSLLVCFSSGEFDREEDDSKGSLACLIWCKDEIYQAIRSLTVASQGGV